MGGVVTGQDVVELVACGARDVALGTVLFSDPDAPSRVRAEIASVDLDDAFGTAHKASEVLA
jgi:dihydroorotate dehydrogenase